MTKGKLPAGIVGTDFHVGRMHLRERDRFLPALLALRLMAQVRHGVGARVALFHSRKVFQLDRQARDGVYRA